LGKGKEKKEERELEKALKPEPPLKGGTKSRSGRDALNAASQGRITTIESNTTT